MQSSNGAENTVFCAKKSNNPRIFTKSYSSPGCTYQTNTGYLFFNMF